MLKLSVQPSEKIQKVSKTQLTYPTILLLCNCKHNKGANDGKRF